MRLDDSGTIGGISYAISTLIVFGLVLIIFGLVIDNIAESENIILESTAIPYSAQRGETMDFLLMCWEALPFVGTFCVVLFLVMNGTQRISGGI